MLSEADVRTAVANAIKFRASRTRWLALMHRGFGIEEFADAVERYDEVLAERPSEAPLLRVLRRMVDPDNPLQPEDWDAVELHNDRVLVSALYCDRLGLPDSFAEVLGEMVRQGGYYRTHALLTWIWVRENRCELTLPDGFVEHMHGAVAAIIDDDPTVVNDLKLEAAAFLCLARQGARVDPGFVRRVIALQNDDGGWGKPDDGGSRKPDESSWHSTVLALLLLLHVEFPGARGTGEA